jgi:hypothetical protein
MGNIFVGWIDVSDPPSPWTRLTRQGKYIRNTSDYSNHLVATGSATHNHDGTLGSWSCNNDTAVKIDSWENYQSAMTVHSHNAPSSVSTGSVDNDPPYYGIDLIYMDATTWENSVRSFPVGTLILSYSSINDDSLSRHSASDGYFLYNTTPGTVSGSSSTHNHAISGTTAASGTSGITKDYTDVNYGTAPTSHTHTISITSSSTYPEPAYVQTRLYEVTSIVNKAFQYTVAFFSDTPSSNWTILTAWTNRLIKGGDSDPTNGGSDTHNHTFSGTTSAWIQASPTLEIGNDESSTNTATSHSHTVSGTLASVSNVPPSTQLVPAYLAVTLSIGSVAIPQLVGLSSW